MDVRIFQFYDVCSSLVNPISSAVSYDLLSGSSSKTISRVDEGMNCRLKIEIMNVKANSNCSPCWPEEAPSGAACPCHSSLTEVDLLPLGKG
jgi:hypothetical protein